MAESVVNPRFVVVGAGPAGTRCAQALVAASVRPLVIDEGRRSGGQIYRRQPDNFTRPGSELYGTEAGKAADIHRTFDGLEGKIDYLPDTLIWNIAGNRIYTVSGHRQRTLEFDALILCTGATDRLLPVEGWHRAGAFSLGGAQVALKSQACAIGSQVVFMGTGPLLYLVASQYLKAGADVAAVLDTSSLWRRIRALPKLLCQPKVLWKGMLLTLALYRGGVPVHTGIKPQAITGDDDQGVSGVSFLDSRGRQRKIPCDAVAVGYHLRPETQLADLARCRLRFDDVTRQWLPEIDSDGRSSVEDVYLAGDGARILGADAAEASGELAALAALADLGFTVSPTRVNALRKTLTRWQVFARGLAEAFPWPHRLARELTADTVLCRCETITVGQLRTALHDSDTDEVNRAKALTRVGMGRCQGRFCGNAAAEVVAACIDKPVENVGRLRGQAPVKPLPINLMEDDA